MAAHGSIHDGGLHYILWLRRDAHDTVRLVQNDLADELRVDQSHLSRILRRMEKAGRLEKVGRGLFHVLNPATWEP